MPKPRPALFEWQHFEPEIIVCAVRWYLRFSLSHRDVAELLMERSLPADHTTISRWVQRYAPELNKRCRRELKPTHGSWRVDETYICQGGSWRTCIVPGIPPADFWVSARSVMRRRPSGSSKGLLAPCHPQPLFETNVTDQFTLFAVTRDGQRFLIPTTMREAGPTPAMVVINWIAGIKR